MTTTSRPATVIRPVTTTTARTLRALRAWLLVGSVLVFASAGVLYGGYRSANVVAAKAELASEYVGDTRDALVEADADAIAAFARGAPLGGPGSAYLSEIARASRSLQLVAGVDETGGTTTRPQVIDAMISSYVGLVANAANAGAAAKAELLDASTFMHMQDGILSEVDNLEADESRGLHAEDATFWTDPWTVPIWLVPVVALLVLLVCGQVYVGRRFRRVINPALAVAAVLLFGFAVAGPVFALSADHELATSVGTLDRVGADRSAQDADAAATNEGRLAGLLPGTCANALAGCHATQDALHHPQRSATTPATAGQDRVLADAAHAGQVDATDTDLGLTIGLAVTAVAVAGLVLIGLWRRINDYRYRT